MWTDFAPSSSRRIAFQFPTESKPLARYWYVASVERRAFIFVHTSDPFRAIIATRLLHTARAADQLYIARTIRSSHITRTRITDVAVVVVVGGGGGGVAVGVVVVVVVVVVVFTFARIIKSVVIGQATGLGAVCMDGGEQAGAKEQRGTESPATFSTCA